MNGLKISSAGFFYKYILRPIYFHQNPEKIHDSHIRIGKLLGKYRFLRFLTGRLFCYQNPILEQKILGLNFANPVGLAAGFDKDANLIEIVPAVGFGFMEVGTVTADPYQGNPKPRLFRLPVSKAIVVNYGLKNLGVKKIISRISGRKTSDFSLGISVGYTNSPQNKDFKKAIDDYHLCLKKIIENRCGGFYVINISCPNTFGGEPFTTPERLQLLLQKFVDLKINKPIFLKMPINLGWNDFKKLLEVAVEFKIDGVVIGNLNKNHQDKSIRDKIPVNIKGGISGKPCWQLSNDLISKTYQLYGKRLVIIGVGGIFSAGDAYEKIKRGASLVELITGMIYEGQQLIGEINRGLVGLLQKDGYNNISQAIGAYHKR